MVTLKHLVNRIEHREKLLRDYPEQKEMLEKGIQRAKDEIILCVMENKNNVLLEKIWKR